MQQEEDVFTVIRQMLLCANINDCTVEGNFDGVNVVLNPGDSVDDVFETYASAVE